MQMTLEQYILNPMGKSNAVLNSIMRETMRKTYTVKFDNILLRENGKIEYYLFRDDKKNTYWAYIKVPSETVRDFYYDVVFKFYADQSVSSSGEDLFKYYTNFYSNDPSFVFTYANVFKNNNIFIQELSSKMSREALKTSPKEKNPTNDIGYVKAFYFAYLLMQNRKLNKLSKFKEEAKPLDVKFLLDNIMIADDKVALRQEEGSKVSHKKKIVLDPKLGNKVARIASKNGNFNATDSRLQVTTTKKVKTIQNKNVSTTSTTKKTKRI